MCMHNNIYDSIKVLVFFYINMKACTCFLLFGTFAYINTSLLNTSKEDNAKVVLKLNVKENSKNVIVATNETYTEENKIPRTDLKAPRVETFTEFIQEVINILQTYEDTAFIDFFGILGEEIRKYYYRGCKLYELTDNYEFRSLMTEKLDLIKRKSVLVLKADINKVMDMIGHETYDKNVKELLDYINSLYREDAIEMFGKVLSELKAYGNSTSEKPKNYLVKIIRDGVRDIVFNHYTDLNINFRRELKEKIATCLKNIKETPLSSTKTNLFPCNLAVREPENTVKITKHNIAIKDEKPEHSLKIDPISTADNNIPIIKTSAEKHQEEATKLKTSKEENNSQQPQLSYLSIDETSDVTIERNSIEVSQDRLGEFNAKTRATLYTEDIPCKTTEKPEIIYTSELKNKLVQRMLINESTGRLPTEPPTTMPRLRLTSDEDLSRSIAPSMPEEELSIDVFDTEEIKRQTSLAKSNRITTVQHGMKHYIKRMRNLQNKVNQLNKIGECSQNNRMNVISNGYKVKNGVDKYEAKESKNKVREPKRNVKKSSSVNEDVEDIYSNKEKVKTNYIHAYKLKNKKKSRRSKTKKAKLSTKTVKSAKNPVHRSSELLPIAKNNAGNTIVNDTHKKLTIATFKKVSNATFNVTEEVEQKIINNTANNNYVTKINPTHRYRRVLEFSSPLLYDQPFFDDYTFQEGLHTAHR